MVQFHSLKQEEAKVWKLYEQIREKGGLYCPAFKTHIEFSLQGWRHLIGATGHTKRTSTEKYRRLKLFPYVKIILGKSATIQNVRKNKTHTDYALEAVIEVEYDGKTEMSKVRVVIREDKIGKKRFHSIMDKRNRKRRFNRRAPHASVR